MPSRKRRNRTNNPLETMRIDDGVNSSDQGNKENGEKKKPLSTLAKGIILFATMLATGLTTGLVLYFSPVALAAVATFALFKGLFVLLTSSSFIAVMSLISGSIPAFFVGIGTLLKKGFSYFKGNNPVEAEITVPGSIQTGTPSNDTGNTNILSIAPVAGNNPVPDQPIAVQGNNPAPGNNPLPAQPIAVQGNNPVLGSTSVPAQPPVVHGNNPIPAQLPVVPGSNPAPTQVISNLVQNAEAARVEAEISALIEAEKALVERRKVLEKTPPSNATSRNSLAFNPLFFGNEPEADQNKFVADKLAAEQAKKAAQIARDAARPIDPFSHNRF